MAEHWRPKVGDIVWFNYPDCPEPIGRVVGHTQDFGLEESDGRYGQPVILGPKVAPFKAPSPAQHDMRLFMVHPRFLLPFPYGGPQWKQANAEGRVVD